MEKKPSVQSTLIVQLVFGVKTTKRLWHIPLYLISPGPFFYLLKQSESKVIQVIKICETREFAPPNFGAMLTALLAQRLPTI